MSCLFNKAVAIISTGIGGLKIGGLEVGVLEI
jgi:hypothetical protein